MSGGVRFGGVARQWRWLIVLAGTLLLAALPAVVDAWPVSTAEVEVAELAKRISDSAAVAFSGTVATRGGLAVPDIPGVEEQAELFGSSSRLRVWYARPNRWRVDVLGPVGEIDTYRLRSGIAIWDSQRRLVRIIDDEPEIRLPRAPDLVPPALARRLIAGATPGDMTSLAPVRVAGRAAVGLRITPSDPATTLGRVDIWTDPGSGLALRVVVVPKGNDVPVLEAKFLDIALTSPPEEVTDLDIPDSAEVRREGALDSVGEVGRRSRVELPPSLAGLTRSSDQSLGVATYGEGFVQVLVVAVPRQFATRLLLGSIPSSARPWGGTAQVVESPVINAMALTVGSLSILLAGTVTIAELDRVAATLAVP